LTKLGSYQGRILRVDLTKSTWAAEDLSDEIISRYLGGRALGAYYLHKEVPPKTSPLSPENKLIFFSGPLSGTMAPTTARFNLSTLSPLTNIYLYSVCSGHFGDKLKAAGYDGLIVEGCASKPVVLSIMQNNIQILPADDLWGKDTFITHELLRKRDHGEQVEAACIGPAGENLSKMACVISGTRAAGRGGPGAVMGSKKLKAIVVGGRGEVRLARPEEFYRTVKEMYGKVKGNPFLIDGMRRYGSAVSLGITKQVGIIPCNNWRESDFPGLDSLIPEAVRKTVIKDVACPTCPIGCSKVTRAQADHGTFSGAVTEGPEYETLYSLGSVCNISSLDAVIAADHLCDRLGLDTISCGATISFAMECAEKGILPDSYKDFDLKFGDAETMYKLITLMAYRDGIGNLLADGCLDAAKVIGQGSEHFAMHAKGMELGGYDPRGVKGQALVLACGPRGGCHHAGGYVIALELRGPDRFAFTGKAQMVKTARDLRAFLDSAIYCAFIGVAVDLELGARLVSEATGLDYTVGDAFQLGDRCSCLERVYNNAAGIGRAEDALPPRILYEALPSGPSAGHKLGDELEIMKDEFYQVCGWDHEGRPTSEKLKELGLK
jgi:aldehyde:ferredoxin oxidoreductase